MKKTGICLSLLILLISCNKNGQLEEALRFAGNNRGELETVLNYYHKNPSDSLKYKAACFLIENMPYHYTVEGQTLSAYYTAIDSINRHVSDPEACKQAYKQLYDRLGAPNVGAEIKLDIHHIQADYLIDNIEHAFRHWQEGKWAKHLSFPDFCEYLLPYCFGNENREIWRDSLEARYLPEIAWMDFEDDKKNSSYWATLYLNDQLKKRGFRIHEVFPDSPINHPLSVLENMKMGSCKDYALYTVYVMRACGLPVCMDYTPQWPFRSHGHDWNVLLDNSGKEVPFMGGESNPGYPNKPGYKMAKVFRSTYAYRKGSLFDRKGKEQIPPTFNTPFMKDVSSHYFEGTDITLRINKPENSHSRFAYLAVFNNQEWIPVHWTEIKRNGHVRFTNMGRDIVYLPLLYVNGSLIPAGYPALAALNGTVSPLIADKTQYQRLVLRRKFPVFSGVAYYSSRMVNGRFEASDFPDFRTVVSAGIVTRNPQMRYDTIMTRLERPYRYWRYVSPEYGYGNVAEIEFYSGNTKVEHKGEILTNSSHQAGNREEYVFDGDGLTFYDSADASGCWIGIDFGQKVQVDYIRYLPRNDDNNITPGNRYELFYYDTDGMASLGQVVAETDSLVYTRVPTGALYLLKNHTRGKEERIFTYENGKQIWW
jgi:hypothetical protein